MTGSLDAPLVAIDDLEITYDGADSPALVVPRWRVEEGELVLVTGPTGGGKSTLLQALNGLVPHFTGGTLRGHVRIAGRDTASHRPRDLAEVVGLVRQNPAASFVSDTVEDEIAYGMEVLGVAPGVMRRRVEEILDVLGLADVRDRRLSTLSGGQQQRVAIAAVLAAGPRVLVLDEPTSALDPVAAEDVLAALTRLVHDMALTVVLAEHRLERVVHHADRIALVERGVATEPLPPREAMARSAVVPPVVALGKLAGWRPLPLSVREARRAATGLRDRLAPGVETPAVATAPAAGESERRRTWSLRRRPASSRPLQARVTRAQVERGRTPVLRGLDLELPPGDITVLMGRNGSGKSTLLWSLAGRLAPTSGAIEIRRTADGADDLVEPRGLRPSERIRHVGLVPQDAMTLLYADSVAAECAHADSDMRAEPGAAATLLERIAGPVDASLHPRDLSEGQRLGLALAVILAARPALLLLDEPTRGLDYAAKARLVQLLGELAAEGHTILAATHDVELAAEIADRVVLMAGGRVVADDTSAGVLAHSTAYAPQVARVMHPLPLLTVGDVERELDATRLGNHP